MKEGESSFLAFHQTLIFPSSGATLRKVEFELGEGHGAGAGPENGYGIDLVAAGRRGPKCAVPSRASSTRMLTLLLGGALVVGVGVVEDASDCMTGVSGSCIALGACVVSSAVSSSRFWNWCWFFFRHVGIHERQSGERRLSFSLNWLIVVSKQVRK